MKNAPKITKKEARNYLKKWELMNENEPEKVLHMKPSEKLRWLSILMVCSKTLGLDNDEEHEKEVQIVRDRWIRLKEIYSAKKKKFKS